MLLVPQTAAAASKVPLVRLGFPVLSFRSWLYSVYVVLIFFVLSHLRGAKTSRDAIGASGGGTAGSGSYDERRGEEQG